MDLKQSFMNVSETETKYKVVKVTYEVYKLLKIPDDWDTEQIGIFWNKVSYRGQVANVEINEPEQHLDSPNTIQDMDCDVEEWFDC